MISPIRMQVPGRILCLAMAMVISGQVLPGRTLFGQEQAKPAPAIKLVITADHPDSHYRVGETATFTIQASQGGKPLEEGDVLFAFSKDGWQPNSSQTVKVQNGKAQASSQLDEPGFLLLRATCGKTTALAGVAFDPQDLKPSLPVPNDFEQFWEKQKAELAKIPLKSTLTPVQAPVEGVDAFDVQIDGLGGPVSGYFGRPKDAKPKSLPAILFVHGAGVRSSSLGNTSWAAREEGMLALDINAHGIPNGKPNEFYTDLTNGDLKDYRYRGREDREKSYFKGMFLRMVRAIDFLTSQPEWDGKTVIVYGSSQGGYQAIAAAGIDSRVTLICAGVPAGCDHTGIVVNRINGWPKLVPNDSSGKPDPAVLEASRYFDCVNFAARAKCKRAVVTVGFIDTTCPPTGIYAAFNALPVSKAIHFDAGAGHRNTPEASTFMQEAVHKHLAEQK
ncbi:MAG TPA: acetylxylan esterase [Planctomicrobium sp.]|nr:acetylxylan esterase [Planctomicrobium sp.]